MLYTFRIQIDHISKPPVWRRVVVPAQFSFARFHLVIQAVFGWHNSHLYQFSRTQRDWDTVIGIPYDDDLDAMVDTTDSRKIKLSTVFNTEQSYTYLYDFGDSWVHKIKREEVTDKLARKAQCLSGKGLCPPEDCGGPSGYEELKEIMKQPKHKEYAEMSEWLGVGGNAVFNPAAFELKRAQRAVQNV